MLKFNLKRVFALRGIDKGYAFLIKNGFLRATAYQLAANQVQSLKIKHIETICRALNCTPNDLFEWKADENDTLGENHSLNSLKRGKIPARLSQIVKDIPVDKLDRVEELLTQLRDNVE